MKPNAVQIQLPDSVRQLMNRLNGASCAAYAVGGALRDALLGLEPSDWDVATSASPDQVKALFPDVKITETGIRHGTLTLMLADRSVEVTTFRAESGYSDRRRPDRVTFLQDPAADLARRDFTVNAMACGADGQFLDPFGGRADLEHRILRCVGDPEERFREDPLRILRLLRFASKLGFSIEPQTRQAASASRDLLKTVSAERIASELTGILCGGSAGAVLASDGEILLPVLPEIGPMIGCEQNNPYHDKTVWMHTLAVVDAIPRERILRLTAFFHDMGKPARKTTDENGVDHFRGHPQKSAEMAEEILRRLAFDRDTIGRVIHLVSRHDLRCDGSERACGRLLYKIGPEYFDAWMALRRADTMGQSPRFRADSLALLDRTEQTCRRLIEEKRCFSLSDLALNGADLKAIGIPEGPGMGALLEQLTEEAAEGLCPNEKEALLARAGAIRTPEA